MLIITVSVRRIRPDEGPKFRAIRLEAISDSPQAFGSTLAETAARPDGYWEERARNGAAGDENVLFVAEDVDRWIGLAGGFLDDAPAPRFADLVSMWVHPDHRGHGVGRRLVDAVVAWARERGVGQVVLWVTRGNEAATLLYRRRGFRETGKTQELPSHPELVEQEMALDLTEAESSTREFDALWNYDDPSGTEARFRRLLPRVRASGDPSYLAELLTQIARTEGLQQRFKEAHRTLDEAESLLAAAGDRARVRYLLERGRAFNSANREAEARPFFLQAWELARGLGEDFYAVDAAHMVAIVEPPEQQLEWHERAMRAAQESADPRARGWLGSLYNNAGWTYHDLGRYEEALATFQQGLEWQRQAGKEREAGIAAWTVGRALRSLGRYEEALQMQLANLERLEEVGEPDGYAQEEIGECLLALGREEEARPYFARAHALLAGDSWLKRDQPERLDRLAALGRASA